MNYIERFYGIEYLDKQKGTLLKMSRPKGVPYFLAGDDEAAKIRQTEFNKYLELAFRHDIIDSDLKTRLFSNKWDVFFQAYRELMCAYFIEKILNYKISFRPKGSGRSIGECLLEYSGRESIFIEVKSPFREVPKGAWAGNDSKVIKNNLKRAIKQMPLDGRKNMMILAADLRIPISSWVSGIKEALYGRDIISVPIISDGVVPGEPRLKFKPSGMFQPKVNTRIGAVATLEDRISSPYLESCLAHIISNKKVPFNDSLPRNTFEYIFKVYHNPYAKSPIGRDLFKDYPQVVRNLTTNKMEWINNNGGLS